MTMIDTVSAAATAQIDHGNAKANLRENSDFGNWDGELGTGDWGVGIGD